MISSEMQNDSLMHRDGLKNKVSLADVAGKYGEGNAASVSVIAVLLKVIYHPFYSINKFVRNKSKLPQDGAQVFPYMGDWLSCDPLRGSHDSQSPPYMGWLAIMYPSERVTW